jgi:putative nucleotidyltransferase with HDIG domain
MTIDLPPTPRLLLDSVYQRLPRNRSHAYLVGGFLRDLLAGRSSHDLDIVVSSNSLGMAQGLADGFGGAYYPLDAEREVGRAIIDLPDGQWTVDVSLMAGSLETDLALRDFTIDALALSVLDLNAPRVIDHHGGIQDLHAGLVRAISEQALVSDPARLLRAVRLAGSFGFTIEPETRAWVQRHAADVAQVSGERARDEFSRILTLVHSLPSLREMDNLGLLTTLIPELETCRGVEQPKEHFWDVFDHNMETVGYGERILWRGDRERDPFLREVPWRERFDEHFQELLSGNRPRAVAFKIACLLHDVAKPQTKALQPNGRTRFFGHGEMGAEIAGGMMERLRFSRRESQAVARMVQEHLRPVQISQKWEPPSRRAVYRYLRELGDVYVDTLYLSMADHLAAVGPRLEMEEWRKHTLLTEQVLEMAEGDDSVSTPPRLVDGHDLMDALGIAQGPQLGRILESVREAQAAGEVRTKEEALALAARLQREG